MARRGKTKTGTWGPVSPDTGERRTISGVHDTNSGGGHFVTRDKIDNFSRIMRTFPDPDPILRKMGRGIAALQDLLTDSHMESVWTVRCAATSGVEWSISAGEGARGKAAADAFSGELKKMDVPRIIEEMMDAVAYGYSPLEIIWRARDDGTWGIDNIVGKPPQCFEFDQDNNLVLKTGAGAQEKPPENRILLVQHRPSYANPYGVKVFSKCFWPAMFKKNGFQWWTVFVEKYGGSYLLGKYPSNAGEEYKNELMRALEHMASDAVAIAPEGSEIEITGAADRRGSNDVFQSYIQMANAEISKAVLGETLTTEIGDTGSYAAAKTHNDVRKDIAAADRRRISEAFNRLAAVYSFYNFGGDTAPPRFEFLEDEDLKIERTKRDVELYKTGVRPTRAYIKDMYGLEDKYFTIADDDEREPEKNGVMPWGSLVGRSCGCHDNTKPGIFTSRSRRQGDAELMNEFEGRILGRAQKETDETIDAYIDAMGTAHNFDEAREALLSAYDRVSGEQYARFIDEARYAAGQIGARSGGKGGGHRGRI
jgi:phage gp29-like protein